MIIELRVDGDLRRIEPEVVIVVGYTGADAAAVKHHIDELAAEGIAPPPRVPMYWAMPASSLTQEPVIEVPSGATSGEIELALVVDGNAVDGNAVDGSVVNGDEILVAAGSDHTCREAEAIDIRLSKLICPIPLSTDALRWDAVADRWADLELASTVSTDDGEPEPYQSATAGGNRPPKELLDAIPWAGRRPNSFVVLCGTVPAIGGIRPADRFQGSITDPVSGHRLGLDYRIRPVPELAGGLS